MCLQRTANPLYNIILYFFRLTIAINAYETYGIISVNVKIFPLFTPLLMHCLLELNNH